VPPALVDVIPLLALVALLTVAFVHPPEWLEATVGVAAVVLVLTATDLGSTAALDEVRRLLPVVLFLSAILVVATLCAAEGVFSALGALLARLARHRPPRMLALTFVAAALTTAVLSLDATVVLLTPMVVAAATTTGTSHRPVAYACIRLANSASLLLPVSNLTNLLALPYLDVDFHEFAVLMAPVWLVVIGVEYVGHRVFFRRDLVAIPVDTDPPPPPRMPRFPLLVIAAMLVGFAVGSPLGVEPAWVAGAAALVLAGHALAHRRTTVRAVVHATHLSFAVFVLGLGVVVAALATGGLGRVVTAAVPDGSGLVDLLLLALVATVLANLVNNLPATLLLVPLVAPLGTTAVLAALVGLNVGSGLTYPGSLANLLWRRSMIRHGERPSARDFHRLSALLTPPAVVAAVVALWAWTGVLGTS
jgi:arsenical pump membrane protein